MVVETDAAAIRQVDVAGHQHQKRRRGRHEIINTTAAANRHDWGRDDKHRNLIASLDYSI